MSTYEDQFPSELPSEALNTSTTTETSQVTESSTQSAPQKHLRIKLTALLPKWCKAKTVSGSYLQM